MSGDEVRKLVGCVWVVGVAAGMWVDWDGHIPWQKGLVLLLLTVVLGGAMGTKFILGKLSDGGVILED
jgi:hypothetical protein